MVVKNVVVLILIVFLPLTLLGKIDIIFPPNRSVVSNKVIYVILGEGEGDADSATVTLNEKKFLFDKKLGTIFHSALRLKLGENSITVSVFRNGQSKNRTVSVFCQPERANRLTAPGGYEKLAFHIDKNQSLCSDCHSFEIEEKREKEDFDCYICHKLKFKKRFLHPPFRSLNCFSCHKEDGESLRFGLMVKKSEICLICHEEFENKFMHGPVAIKGCLICHNPHSSDEPSLLFATINEVCLTCHSPLTYAVDHPVSNHPVRGKLDKRSGSELSCASCHNPHSSPYKYFLLAKKGNLCRKCHKL